jgi:uncharacterized protein YegL
MPILTDDMASKAITGSNFAFSHTKLEKLSADRYCLGTIVIDVTGSVYRLERQIEGCLQNVVKMCSDPDKNPMADNMMLRVILFSDRFDKGIREVHGFRLIPEIATQDYDGIIETRGTTPLYDAAFSAIQATVDFGKDLVDDGYLVNGIAFVITDGEDNSSKMGRQSVKKAIEDAVRGEHLESFRPVLVGLRVDPQSKTSHWLDLFRNEAGFDQYEPIGNADSATMAKLTGWISKSLSSQSQSLGSGGPSQSLAI